MVGLSQDFYYTWHQLYVHTNASPHVRLCSLSNVISHQALQLFMGKWSKPDVHSALMQEGLAMLGYQATPIHTQDRYMIFYLIFLFI